MNVVPVSARLAQYVRFAAIVLDSGLGLGGELHGDLVPQLEDGIEATLPLCHTELRVDPNLVAECREQRIEGALREPPLRLRKLSEGELVLAFPLGVLDDIEAASATEVGVIVDRTEVVPDAIIKMKGVTE